MKGADGETGKREEDGVWEGRLDTHAGDAVSHEDKPPALHLRWTECALSDADAIKMTTSLKAVPILISHFFTSLDRMTGHSH